MQGFLHQLFSGLATGGIYASLGLAAVMIYQSTHHLNFAQGEMAMFSTYIAWALLNAGLSYWIAVPVTLAVSFVGGFAIERLIVRRGAGKPALTTVMLFIGMLMVFNSMAGFTFGYTTKTFPSPFPLWLRMGDFLSAHEAGSILVSLFLVLILFTFFRFTKLGSNMRAAAYNPSSAQLMGIKVGLMSAIGWGFAGIIGAVAGILVAPTVYLDPNMMSGVLIYGFAAALLGGLDSPFGAVFAGFLIGTIENLLGAYVIGTELKLSVALVLIIGVLLVRPAGLFGKNVVIRV